MCSQIWGIQIFISKQLKTNDLWVCLMKNNMLIIFFTANSNFMSKQLKNTVFINAKRPFSLVFKKHLIITVSKMFRTLFWIGWYCKNPKISDTRKIAVVTLKLKQYCFIQSNWYKGCWRDDKQCRLWSDCSSDQTAPKGAVWSGSTLFAQTCPSENLGK